MKTRLLFVLTFIVVLAQAQVPSGASRTYKFDNASIGDLTPYGSSRLGTADRDNLSNNALDLNGDRLQSNPGFNRDNSLSFWIKTTTNDSDRRTIIDASKRDSDFDNASDIGFYVYLIGGKVGIASGFRVLSTQTGNVLYNSGYSYATSTTIVADGLWHHVAVTRDDLENTPPPGSSSIRAVEIKVYVDGVLEQTDRDFRGPTSNSTMQPQLSGLFTIGDNETRNLSQNRRYHDEIDDIRLYRNKVFNVAEVQDLFMESSCAPTGLNVSNITTTSADVSWVTQPTQDSWDVSYGVTPTAAGAGTSIINLMTPNLSITGLQPSTSYDVYVRSVCSGNPSVWRKITFVTSDPPIFVDIDATGSNDGTSWANAYTNLKTALDNNPTSEFWVAAGTYKASSGDRTLSFNLTADQKLYGGFDGTETIRSQRDPQTNVTILSGDINGDDTGAASFSNTTLNDNSYRVVRMLGNNAIIDGVTISGGNANHPSDNDLKEGAGIWISGTGVSNIKVLNCKVIGNRSSRGGAIRGGTDGSGNSVSIERTLIAENYAEFAPVFYNVQNSGDIDITFSNCVIRENVCARANNTAASNVAGIWIRTQNSGTTTTTIVNSTITDNTSLNSPSSSLLIVPTRSQSGSGTFNLYNSIVANNQGSNNNEFTPVGINSGFSSQTLVFNHNLTSIGLSGGSGSDNIIASPTFVDASMDDYQLASGSMGIDVGDNALVQANTAEDYLGNARIFNTTVDMGAFEFGSMALSTEEFEQNKGEIKLYPNPTSNVINIEVQNLQIKNVQIYDMLGKQIINSTRTEINVSNLKAGIYLLKANTTLGEVVKRFIKH